MGIPGSSTLPSPTQSLAFLFHFLPEVRPAVICDAHEDPALFAVLYPSYHLQIHIMTGSHGTVVGYALMRHALAHHNQPANHIAAHSNLPHHHQRDVQFRLTVYCDIGSGRTSISRNNVFLIMPSGPMTRCYKIPSLLIALQRCRAHAFCRRRRCNNLHLGLEQHDFLFLFSVALHISHHPICSD